MPEIAAAAGGSCATRVVNAAEHARRLPDERVELRPDLDTAVVRLVGGGTVGTADIAAVHVDLAGAAELVEAAVAAVDEADLGDEDAELTVGDALDVDLAWYDAAELPFLLSLL